VKNEPDQPTAVSKTAIVAIKVRVAKDGPYLVSGSLPLLTETIGTNREGDSVKWKPGATD
jgi:hypothetical protein